MGLVEDYKAEVHECPVCGTRGHPIEKMNALLCEKCRSILYYIGPNGKSLTFVAQKGRRIIE